MQKVVQKTDAWLIIPPLTQMNTPYPSTAYLSGYLRPLGYQIEQSDLGLELLLKILTPEGLEQISQEIRLNLKKQKNKAVAESLQFFVETMADYKMTIQPVIRFLQGQDPSLALRLSKRQFVPEGPRFLPLLDHPEILQFFGELGVQDRAKYIASLYIDDIADTIKNGIDPHFELAKYGEKLASSQSSFDQLYKKLTGSESFIDLQLRSLVQNHLERIQPRVIGLTCPFPGNVYSAFKIGQIVKQLSPSTQVVLGGGYANTELRELSDARVFEFIDEIILDDGEKSLELILQNSPQRLRSLRLENGKVTLVTPQTAHKLNSISNGIAKIAIGDVPFKNHPGPDYRGLPLKQYFSMLEMPNPMHRMWSDFRWNKLILAHGCYWKKCTFCDVSLDYIGRFEPQKASQLVDQIEKIIEQTGSTGFHFVDEAAPPALLKQLSHELIKRNLKISWWGNIRFDSYFTEELTQLMADAGCVAVTGGLEVASPRVLKLINKGVSISEVKKVTKAFKKANIYVHAYLMYGFPSQTEKETIESLEVVRNLFKKKYIDSAHWHRFVATVHSPVGKNPDQYKIQLQMPKPSQHGLFALNQVDFVDSIPTDHDRLGVALRKALYNYMHGMGLDTPAEDWF